MRTLLFATGFLILFLTEIARVYFIMPFPGSQQSETIALAYFIQSYLGVIRLIGLLIIGFPLYQYFVGGSRKEKLTIGSIFLFYLVIFYLFNFKFLAEKMFYQPRMKSLVAVNENKVSTDQLVLGVSINGQAKAYPIEIIGYHHQVRDTVGNSSIMVTYCTVCRTGRVFSPEVDGQAETFRLVGMDHFNAMFEDSRTRSWWRQVTGEAIAGKMKGHVLQEIPSQQMGLKAWISEHPNTLIMQPDPAFKEDYDDLADYDEGKSKSKLTGTDSGSWKNKSWVVGVQAGLYARAYDWNDLKTHRIINDQLATLPLVVALESDSVSFHSWRRVVGQDTLRFEMNDSLQLMTDSNTHSSWDWSGHCLSGKLKDKQLEPLQSYQEFWHSWRTFHPQTTQFVFLTGK